jgi:hypothetical protein
MAEGLVNKVQTTVATLMTAAQTTVTVATADVGKLPPSGTTSAIVFWNDLTNGPWEIATATFNGTATFPIIRASEAISGTQTPQAWTAGTNVAVIISAASFQRLVQAFAPVSSAGFSGASTLSNTQVVDVAMTNANQYYDGPQVVLTPGTWFLAGYISAVNATNATDFTAKLWDGASNVVAGGEQSRAVAGKPALINLHGIVTLTSTATFRMSVAADNAGSLIKAQAIDNSSGFNANMITAIPLIPPAGSGVLNPIQVFGPIATPQANMVFSNIPQTGYRNLRLVLHVRGTNATATTNLIMQFNGDTAANYTTQQLLATGASVTGSAVSGSSISLGDAVAATGVPNSSSAFVVDILDYTSQNFW